MNLGSLDANDFVPKFPNLPGTANTLFDIMFRVYRSMREHLTDDDNKIIWERFVIFLRKLDSWKVNRTDDTYFYARDNLRFPVKEIDKLYGHVEYACCIYPCSPLLLPSDLIEAFNILESSEVDFVYPIVEYPHPIFRSMRKSKNGKMEFLHPEYELTRTQDLESVFHDAGQFYWGKAEAWRELKKMHTDGIGMEIPSYRVVDIDTEDDWKRAEMLSRSN